jgi:hypothetical protein
MVWPTYCYFLKKGRELYICMELVVSKWLNIPYKPTLTFNFYFFTRVLHTIEVLSVILICINALPPPTPPQPTPHFSAGQALCTSVRHYMLRQLIDVNRVLWRRAIFDYSMTTKYHTFVFLIYIFLYYYLTTPSVVQILWCRKME